MTATPQGLRLTAYTVRPLPPPPYDGLYRSIGITHTVDLNNEVGARAVALCFSEADAQRIAALLNGVPERQG